MSRNPELLEEIRRMLAELLPGAIAEAVQKTTTQQRILFSGRQAATKLGIDRGRLAELISEGAIRTVSDRGRKRISQAELDRIQVEGLVERSSRSPRRKTVKAPPKSTAADVRKIEI